jgi:hypothetical protein
MPETPPALDRRLGTVRSAAADDRVHRRGAGRGQRLDLRAGLPIRRIGVEPDMRRPFPRLRRGGETFFVAIAESYYLSSGCDSLIGRDRVIPATPRVLVNHGDTCAQGRLRDGRFGPRLGWRRDMDRHSRRPPSCPMGRRSALNEICPGCCGDDCHPHTDDRAGDHQGAKRQEKIVNA